MQKSLKLAALFIISITILCPGYGYQSIQAPYYPHNQQQPVYGAPPPIPHVSVPCTKHSVGPASIQKQGLPTSNSAELPAAATNAQSPRYAAPRYLPPPTISQQNPYYQALAGVSSQHYGNAVSGSNIPYTPNHNPLLTPQYSQSTPPTTLTPPPFHGSQLQQHQSHSSSQHFVEQNNGLGTSGSASNHQPIGSAPQSQSPVSPVDGVLGNYISQAEVGQLDHYFEKQNPVGSVRAYSRLIHTCYPDGRCEQQQLNGGQVDPKFQHFVLMARARVQPISNKCRALAAYGPAGTNDSKTFSAASNGLPNRRRYQYTEVVQPSESFN